MTRIPAERVKFKGLRQLVQPLDEIRALVENYANRDRFPIVALRPPRCQVANQLHFILFFVLRLKF